MELRTGVSKINCPNHSSIHAKVLISYLIGYRSSGPELHMSEPRALSLIDPSPWYKPSNRSWYSTILVQTGVGDQGSAAPPPIKAIGCECHNNFIEGSIQPSRGLHICQLTVIRPIAAREGLPN